MNKSTFILIVLSIFSAIQSERLILELSNKECTHHLLNYFQKANLILSHLEHINFIIIESAIINFSIINNIPRRKECIKNMTEDQVVYREKPIFSQGETDKKQWHLKRINTVDLPLKDSVERRITPSANSHVIIIDSGIDGNHNELKNNVAPAEQHKSFVKSDSCCKSDSDPLCDCGEHGTHCAGLVASVTAGYNLSTQLHSIKVFDKAGSSTYSIILQGMNQAITIKNKYFKNEATIVSMSLGGSVNKLINSAVTLLKKANIFVVVAGGNDSQDACNYSPASSPDAFTVGASNINDGRAYFSNVGDCIDIFAPGLDIYSTKPNNSYQFMSGTSMATPIVAGFSSAVASSLGITDPDEIKSAVLSHVNADKIKDSRSKNNFLPYDGEKSLFFLDN